MNVIKEFFSKDIKTANEEIKRLSLELETVKGQLADANTKIVAGEATNVETAKAKTDLEQQIINLKAEHQTSIEALNKQIETEKKSEFKKASQLLASIGIPEEQVAISEKDNSKETFTSKFKVTRIQSRKQS